MNSHAAMIPETRFDILDLLPPGPIRGVEVGTDQGVYAAALLASRPDLFLYTVDPWLPYDDGIVPMKDNRSYAMGQYGLNMRPFEGRYTHTRLSSTEAAGKMRDFNTRTLALELPQIDFVYIDAAHDEASVRQDLEAWWPLVKPGGLMAGHDFDHPGVATPVITFAKAHRLDLRVINEHGGPDLADDGASGKRPGSGQDRVGGWAHIGWFWFKGKE